MNKSRNDPVDQIARERAESERQLVYKYGSADCVEFYLNDQTLQFASAETLNDCFEAYPNLSQELGSSMENIIHKAYSERERIHRALVNLSLEDFRSWMYDDPDMGNIARAIALRSTWLVSQRRFSQIGILSLSSKWNNLLLWSHYTRTGNLPVSGLCVGFDSSAKVFQEGGIQEAGMTGLQPVRYTDARPRISGSTIAERLAILLTKSLDWSYEAEMRCFRELSPDRRPVREHFNANVLRKIILGPNMPRKSILRCAELQKAKFPEAELFMATPDVEAYTMTRFSLPTSPRILESMLTALPEGIGSFDMSKLRKR